ncbi:MAG TPA: epoxide hydrolase, partial [Candidatus Limnocylindrales bacterium]|nr:epoxide hydrolase [Candidatus Limnocylindrales bacterium]
AGLRPSVEPFEIRVPDAELDDLRARIRATRWPDPSPAEPWEQGTDLEYLRSLLAAWADDFDWRAAERRLNELPHLVATIDGVRIHAVHVRSATRPAIPLVLTHGWPSTFLEYLPLVPLLSEPAAHGIAGPAFDLVIPSLPGYAFSERPARTGVNYRVVAHLWHGLMAALGYERYGAGGGDFGAGVATFMALEAPERLIGLYLSTPELRPYLGPGSRQLSVAEARYVTALDAWGDREGAYRSIQATKPQTLAYGLTDSPAGLAAWVVEKWRTWSDSGGDPEAATGRDGLLAMLTILWATRSMGTSLRDYYDNRRFPPEIGPRTRVAVPTAIASFPHAYVSEGEEVREWAERLYDVRRWTRHPHGGHFGAIEAPDPYARDLAAFFGGL